MTAMVILRDELLHAYPWPSRRITVARGVRHGTVSLAREEEEASRTAVAEGPELADAAPLKLHRLR